MPMRKTALALASLAAVVLFAAMSPPPVEKLIEGQARCGGAVCLGDSKTAVRVQNDLRLAKPIFPDDTTLGVVIDGGLTVVGAVTLNSTLTGPGAISPAVIDAGVALIRGDLQVAGNYVCGAAGMCGSIALSSASPSTATVTVPSGVSCACWPVGTTAAIAAAGCAANVSSTTLTLTGPNTVTTTMRYMCFK